MDVAAVKLFATNRNGAEAVNVLLRELTIHADRISGLGTLVRTVFDEVIYTEPTSLDNGVLTLGGPPKVPAANLPDLPDDVFGNAKPKPDAAAKCGKRGCRPGGGNSSSCPLSLPRPLPCRPRGCGRGHAGGCRDGRSRRGDAGRCQSSREPSRRRWPRAWPGRPYSPSSPVLPSRKCGCRSMRSRASASSACPR